MSEEIKKQMDERITPKEKFIKKLEKIFSFGKGFSEQEIKDVETKIKKEIKDISEILFKECRYCGCELDNNKGICFNCNPHTWDDK